MLFFLERKFQNTEQENPSLEGDLNKQTKNVVSNFYWLERTYLSTVSEKNYSRFYSYIKKNYSKISVLTLPSCCCCCLNPKVLGQLAGWLEAISPGWTWLCFLSFKMLFPLFSVSNNDVDIIEYKILIREDELLAKHWCLWMWW